MLAGTPVSKQHLLLGPMPCATLSADAGVSVLPSANIVDMNADCLAAHAWVREVLNGLLADADGAGAGPAVDVDRIALAGYSCVLALAGSEVLQKSSG